MEIKLTKEQYEDLVKVVYLGSWMINSFRTDDEIKKFEDLEQHILSYSKDFDLQKSIVYDDKLARFFPTREFEEGEVYQYIDEYDDYNFWDELIYRLARRDFVKKYGESKIKKMSIEERFEKEDPFIEMYESEVENYGIERLEIKGEKI